MIKVWKEIERLISVKAIHRSGFKLDEVKPEFILNQMLGEFDELTKSPDDPSELGDLLGIMLHYAIKQGWTLEQLETLILQKFKVRFVEESVNV